MKSSQIYLRFIALSKVIEKSSILPVLDPIEERMLNVIAMANTNKERLSVKDMMSKSDISSPATMHKNIQSLISKGWIFLEETSDARRKQLQLTKETLKYYTKLGHALEKSIK